MQGQGWTPGIDGWIDRWELTDGKNVRDSCRLYIYFSLHWLAAYAVLHVLPARFGSRT